MSAETSGIRRGFIVETGGAVNSIVPIPPTVVSVGSDPSAGICLPYVGVSRRHVELDGTGPIVFVTDAHSTNGTWVNDHREANRTPLRDGDRVKLGNVILRYFDVESAGNNTTKAPTGGNKKVTGWLLAGVGIFLTAIIGAGATYLFNRTTESIEQRDVPFNANLADYSDDCEGFVIDRVLLDQVQVDGGSVNEAWVFEHGGLQAGPRTIQLSLVSSEQSAVAINAIALTDLTVYPLPNDPILIRECSPGGGELADHSLHLDFATSSVRISSPTEGQLDFPFRIDSADPEVFQVTTTSVEGVESDCFCTWRLRVQWTSGTGEGEEIVDMDGQPVAVVNAKPYQIYWLENGVWVTY